MPHGNHRRRLPFFELFFADFFGAARLAAPFLVGFLADFFGAERLAALFLADFFALFFALFFAAFFPPLRDADFLAPFAALAPRDAGLAADFFAAFRDDPALPAPGRDPAEAFDPELFEPAEEFDPELFEPAEDFDPELRDPALGDEPPRDAELLEPLRDDEVPPRAPVLPLVLLAVVATAFLTTFLRGRDATAPGAGSGTSGRGGDAGADASPSSDPYWKSNDPSLITIGALLLGSGR